MLARVFAVSALALVASAADDDVFPAVGDMGGMKIIEGSSCVVEQQDNEEEDGMEVNPAATAICLDKCANEGYIIEQTNMTTGTNEDGDVEEFWNLKLTPKVSCIDGCGCPMGIGRAEKGEQNDEGGYEIPEQYELTFFDPDGEPSAELSEGELKVQYADADDATPQIIFKLNYMALEQKDEEDDKQQQPEYRREECELTFDISEGKIGGINSGAEAPQYSPAPDSHATGSLQMTGAVMGACAEFTEGTADWCTYQCSKKYEVMTNGIEVMFVPESGFINADCKCPWGMGFQKNVGAEFEQAQISFDVKEEICTPGFAANASVAITANTDAYGAFTITHPMSSGGDCTYTYRVDGKVMNALSSPASGEHDPVDVSSEGEIILAFIISIAVVIGFCAPCFMNKKDGESSL